MAKRKQTKKHRAHKSIVGGVLAAALAFAVVVGGQIGSYDSGQLSTDMASCQSGGGTWTESTQFCQMPAATHTCPNGQYWDTARNMCYGTATTTTSSTIACASLGQRPFTPAECDAADQRRIACASPNVWDGNSGSGTCTAPTTTTTTSGGSASSYVTQATCQSAYYFWYNNVCNSTAGTATTTTCPSGQYWSGSTCVNNTATVGSCTSGQWWDSATSTCKSNTTTTTTHSCPSGQYWSGSTCVNNTTTSTTCPSGQYWSGSTCVNNTATVGSCTSGQWWDPAASTCKSNTTTTTCSSGQWMCGNGQCSVNNVCPTTSTTTACPTATPYRDQYGNCSATYSTTTNTNTYTSGSGMYPSSEDTRTFWCNSLRRMTNATECDAADTAAGFAKPMQPAFPAFGGNFGGFGPGNFGGFQPGGFGSGMMGTDGSSYTKGGGESTGDYCSTAAARTDFRCRAASFGSEEEVDFGFEFGDYEEGYEFEGDFGGGDLYRFQEDASRILDEYGEVANLEEQIERNEAESAGAYCAGNEKAREYAQRLRENAEFILDASEDQAGEAAARNQEIQDFRQNMHKVFEAMGKCQQSAMILQQLYEMQEQTSYWNSNDKAVAAFVAKIAGLIADPSSLIVDMPEPGRGGRVRGGGKDPMRDLWREKEEIQRSQDHERGARGTCSEIERMREEIGMFVEGGDDFEFEGMPERNAKTEAAAEKALAIIDRALEDGSKKACSSAMRKLQAIEREVFGGGESEGVFFDEEESEKNLLRNNLGIDEQLASFEGQLDADVFAQFEALLNEKLASVQAQIASLVAKVDDLQARLTAAYQDIESLVAGDPALTEVASDITVTEDIFAEVYGEDEAGEFVEEANAAFQEVIQYYPEEQRTEVVENQHDVVEAVNEVLETLPVEFIEDTPEFREILEVVYAQPVSDGGTDIVVEEARIFSNVLSTAVEQDEDGNLVIAEDKEALVEEARDTFIEECEKAVSGEEEEQRQIEEGMLPGELTDLAVLDREDTWAAMEARAAIYATGDKPALFSGKTAADGSKSLALGDAVDISQVATVANRLTFEGEEGSASELNATDRGETPDWAEGHFANLYSEGAIEAGEFNPVAPATKADTAEIFIGALAAANPDFERWFEDQKCILEDVAEDVGCEGHDALNAMVIIGIYNRDADGDGKIEVQPEATSTRDVLMKVSNLVNNFQATVESEGLDTVLTNIQEKFESFGVEIAGVELSASGTPTGNFESYGGSEANEEGGTFAEGI